MAKTQCCVLQSGAALAHISPVQQQCTYLGVGSFCRGVSTQWSQARYKDGLRRSAVFGVCRGLSHKVSRCGDANLDLGSGASASQPASVTVKALTGVSPSLLVAESWLIHMLQIGAAKGYSRRKSHFARRRRIKIGIGAPQTKFWLFMD